MIDALREKLSAPLSAKRLAELAAMGAQEPAPEKPDPIIRAKRNEIARLQQELDVVVIDCGEIADGSD